MTAKDLMIGDWVLFQDPDTQEHEMHQIEQADFAASDKFFDLLSPVKLTTEILEKNNFVIEEEVGWWKTWHITDEALNKMLITSVNCINGGFDWFKYHRGAKVECLNIRFVHELQHALRLCKIEKEIML